MLRVYRFTISLQADKGDNIVDCEDTECIDSEAMRQGRELEDYVARRFMEATSKKVRRANAIFYNEECTFMIADVDRMMLEKVLVWNARQSVHLWRSTGKVIKFRCHIKCSAITTWRLLEQRNST